MDSLTPHYDRINRRCLIELGWPFGDASFLYPDAVKAICRDEMVARWPHLKEPS